MRWQGDIYLDCGQICNRMKDSSRCQEKKDRNKCPAIERIKKITEMKATVALCISKRSGKGNALLL